MLPKSRALAFAVIVLLSLTLAVGYTWLRMRQIASHSAELASTKNSAKVDLVPGPLPSSGFVLFRNTQRASGDGYGRLATVSLTDPGQSRSLRESSCERAHFAGGHGVCLTAERGSVTSYKGFLFDSTLNGATELPPLKGIPSRARISPDGRFAAITVFVSGHSYSPGTFSTRVDIFSTADGSMLAELEQLAVEKDGQPFKEVDFNFWGVTFAADGNRFYATLGSGGQNYLIEGHLAERRAKVIHTGVECPSLSPDGSRVAFKRLTQKSGWHIYMLDLATGAETPLAEQRSVDDQVEWLDDGRILYAFDNDIWVMPADGSGTPEVFLPGAYSPAVVR